MTWNFWMKNKKFCIYVGGEINIGRSSPLWNAKMQVSHFESDLHHKKHKWMLKLGDDYLDPSFEMVLTRALQADSWHLRALIIRGGYIFSTLLLKVVISTRISNLSALRRGIGKPLKCVYQILFLLSFQTNHSNEQHHSISVYQKYSSFITSERSWPYIFVYQWMLPCRSYLITFAHA